MRVYMIRLDQSGRHLDLCGQLSLLAHAIETAIQIMAIGRNVVLKTDIRYADYGGKLVQRYPPEGLRRVWTDVLGMETDPLPGITKTLRVFGKSNKVSSFLDTEMVHWLAEAPGEVHVFMNQFYPETSSSSPEPWSKVINIQHVNACLSPFGVRLLETEKDDEMDETIQLLSQIQSFGQPLYTPLYEKVISMLKFYPTCYDGVRRLLSIYGGDKDEKRQISVLHLRNDAHAVSKWAKAQSIPEQDYLFLLNNKYLACIIEHLSKTMDIIVIGPCLNPNYIVDWMFTNGYRVRTIQKSIPEAELCAMIDMAASENCNHKFVVPYNFEKKRGSTFSYFSTCRLSDSVQIVSFDPLDIVSNIVVR